MLGRSSRTLNLAAPMPTTHFKTRKVCKQRTSRLRMSFSKVSSRDKASTSRRSSRRRSPEALQCRAGLLRTKIAAGCLCCQKGGKFLQVSGRRVSAHLLHPHTCCHHRFQTFQVPVVVVTLRQLRRVSLKFLNASLQLLCLDQLRQIFPGCAHCAAMQRQCCSQCSRILLTLLLYLFCSG